MSEEKQYPLPCGEDMLINFNFGDKEKITVFYF